MVNNRPAVALNKHKINLNDTSGKNHIRFAGISSYSALQSKKVRKTFVLMDIAAKLLDMNRKWDTLNTEDMS